MIGFYFTDELDNSNFRVAEILTDDILTRSGANYIVWDFYKAPEIFRDERIYPKGKL